MQSRTRPWTLFRQISPFGCGSIFSGILCCWHLFVSAKVADIEDLRPNLPTREHCLFPEAQSDLLRD
jgi:hypothetical protein